MSSEFEGLERELAEIDEEEGRRIPTKAARLLPMLVAAVALLSFGAIIYYAYNRGLTTGTEVAAPLITPEGPAKVKPADPGGLEVPHRDKLVYGALDKSADDSRVEQLLPPPEDPMRPPAETAGRQAGTGEPVPQCQAREARHTLQIVSNQGRYSTDHHEEQEPTDDPRDGGSRPEGARNDCSGGRAQPKGNSQAKDHPQQIHGLLDKTTRPTPQKQKQEEAAEKEVEHVSFSGWGSGRSLNRLSTVFAL